MEELRNIDRARGLTIGGTKADLIARLMENDEMKSFATAWEMPKTSDVNEDFSLVRAKECLSIAKESSNFLDGNVKSN